MRYNPFEQIFLERNRSKGGFLCGSGKEDLLKTYNVQPRKRKGSLKWSITYRIPGYSRVYDESFDVLEEAKLRAAEVNYLRSVGKLTPPVKEEKLKMPTLSEFLDFYVSDYGRTHWGDSQYSVVTKQIRDYVKPDRLSSLLLKDIHPRDIDRFYNSLLLTPVVLRPGHSDKGKTVGISVIEKIHVTLKAALNQAVRWGYISKNPVLGATLPKVEHTERAVWTPENALTALDACDDRLLRIAMYLAIGCSMRIGEILGLQWADVHITEQTLLNNSSTLYVRQELKRCEKSALEATALQGKIYFTFPEHKTAHPCKTSLVLKSPKTRTSVRTLYIPNTVANELIKLKDVQETIKKKSGDQYSDFGMVMAQPDGRPTEERLIAKALADLIEKAGLPKVVFHSLRHLSTSMKLQISGGDIKAVQGDTGHAQADMVTREYGHTFEDSRKRVAGLMESSFFCREPKPDDRKTAGKKPDEKSEELYALLGEKPELIDLILTLAKAV